MHNTEHAHAGYVESPEIGAVVADNSFKVFVNSKEEARKLAEFEGKWLVLFFYPADFTFVCPTELEELADLYPEFQKINTEIISVSTDTVFVHKAWQDQSPVIRKIKFPMAADPSGSLCQQFGVYIAREGLARRGTFIIDPSGTLIASEINDNSIGRSASELLRKLQAAQYVLEHPEQVCPASWKPGDKTLKPGMDLVGKI